APSRPEPPEERDRDDDPSHDGLDRGEEVRGHAPAAVAQAAERFRGTVRAPDEDDVGGADDRRHEVADLAEPPEARDDPGLQRPDGEAGERAAHDPPSVTRKKISSRLASFGIPARPAPISARLPWITLRPPWRTSTRWQTSSTSESRCE